MIQRIGVDQVQKMKDHGAQIVEVLGRKEYANVQMNQSSVAGLDKNRPVIVYCWDYQ